MSLIEYPIQYLGPLYLSFYFFWLIRENKAILFWLYLWQLKEYHWSRFFDHFSTSKGKRIFLNPLFSAKIFLLAASLAGYYFITKTGPAAVISSIALPVDYTRAAYVFCFSVLLIFAAEAAVTVLSFFKQRLIHPELTKKSIVFIAITHLAAFLVVIALYYSILGEMGIFDIAIAAFFLLFFDVLTPIFIGLAVMALQPLTDFEKKKILDKANRVRAARPDLTVIGVTGSYGKSITKELLASVLSKNFKVLKTAANQNTEVGVSNALINGLEPDHEIFVCEIGAVHAGKIKLVANAVRPNVGILTGINQQHLAVFGSQQNIIDGKYEIFESLPKNGTAILNWGSELVRQSYESQKDKIKTDNVIFAAKDLAASGILAGVDRLSFTVNYKNESAVLDINARGAFNVEPILLAIAGALACKMAFKDVVDIVKKIDFSKFNIKVKKRADGVRVLSSTYSANPDGVMAHLDYLKLWPGKKAIVMPCLIELGKASKDIHYRIGKKIAGVCDLAIIATQDRFSDIKKGALAAGMKEENIRFSEKPDDTASAVKKILSSGDTLLLEGRLPQGIADLLEK